MEPTPDARPPHAQPPDAAPPDAAAPRRSDERGSLGPVAGLVFRAALALTGLALLLLLVDIGLDWQLPQPVRSALPFALLVGLLVSLTLGVGAFGAAKRPERAPRD